MKKLTLITLALISVLTLSAQDKKKVEEVIFETSITCDHCVNTIMSSLPLEKGVKDVKCDVKTKEVKVSYKKDKTDPEKIKRALEKLGYVAKKKEKDPEKK